MVNMWEGGAHLCLSLLSQLPWSPCPCGRSTHLKLLKQQWKSKTGVFETGEQECVYDNKEAGVCQVYLSSLYLWRRLQVLYGGRRATTLQRSHMTGSEWTGSQVKLDTIGCHSNSYLWRHVWVQSLLLEAIRTQSQVSVSDQYNELAYSSIDVISSAHLWRQCDWSPSALLLLTSSSLGITTN